MIKVAIVILNWNGAEFLKKFLPGLIEHTSKEEAEIIVADNASSDDSLNILKNDFSQVRVIELDKNYGFTGGYNRALEQVDAEYYLLLNSDIEVDDNWLKPMVSFLDRQPEFAACSPMLIDYNKRDMLEYAGAAGGYIDKYGYTFCRGRIFDKLEGIDTVPGKPMEVFWITGACMLIRSQLFTSCGGFDDYFFAHMEEVDLCWRLKNIGYHLAVVPESRVYHVGGGTLPKSNPFKTYLNFRNNLLLLYKNLPEQIHSMTLFKRKLLDGISAVRFLLRLDYKDSFAVIKAHNAYRKKKREYKKYRTEQRQLHGYPSHPEVYNASVVYDFFLAGRRTFSKLRKNFCENMNQGVEN